MAFIIGGPHIIAGPVVKLGTNAAMGSRVSGSRAPSHAA